MYILYSSGVLCMVFCDIYLIDIILYYYTSPSYRLFNIVMFTSIILFFHSVAYDYYSLYCARYASLNTRGDGGGQCGNPERLEKK